VSQWAIDNASRDYPFADGYAYAAGLDQIVDAYVVVAAGIETALSRFNVTGGTADIAVVDARNPAVVVASTANTPAQRIEYGDYIVFTINDAVTKNVVRLTMYRKTVVVSFVGLAVFAAVVHDYATNAITALNGLSGNVFIDLDADTSADLNEDGELVITAKTPSERLGDLPACQPVMTINSVRPGDGGAFTVSSGADNNHRLTPEGYGVRIENLGQPCCTCAEFYNAFNRIAAYDKELATAIETRVTKAITAYATLVKRFGTYVNHRPLVDITKLTNSPKVASGLWGSPVSRAVYAMMRLSTGSYATGLAISLTNSTWYPVSISLTVSSNFTNVAKSGSLRYSTAVGGHREFDGFPGTVVLTLPPGGVCQITSENHDVSMAGVEAVYTASAVISPVTANITPPQGLTNPVSGGTITLTVRDVVPRSATLTRTTT
jgi:hypothetical protein